ncbi:hypothetical protein B0T18DRAFT_492130 [Schizothecium vesticola]|uniref:Secreted protein n=1 Tax=Schizothecium vesticola TaxID=314040 RepID=A0AA40EIG8_9PEZI|nr:hypothetical protein B0T18DRAFT_492130 [Schizothecium vesticola]
MPAISASGSLSARQFAFLLLASVLPSLDGVHPLAVGLSIQEPAASTESSQCRIAIDRNFRLVWGSAFAAFGLAPEHVHRENGGQLSQWLLRISLEFKEELRSEATGLPDAGSRPRDVCSPMWPAVDAARRFWRSYGARTVGGLPHRPHRWRSSAPAPSQSRGARTAELECPWGFVEQWNGRDRAPARESRTKLANGQRPFTNGLSERLGEGGREAVARR